MYIYILPLYSSFLPCTSLSFLPLIPANAPFHSSVLPQTLSLSLTSPCLLKPTAGCARFWGMYAFGVVRMFLANPTDESTLPVLPILFYLNKKRLLPKLPCMDCVWLVMANPKHVAGKSSAEWSCRQENVHFPLFFVPTSLRPRPLKTGMALMHVCRGNNSRTHPHKHKKLYTDIHILAHVFCAQMQCRWDSLI